MNKFQPSALAIMEGQTVRPVQRNNKIPEQWNLFLVGN